MLAAATRRITSLIWWFGIIFTGLIGLTATLELVVRAAAAAFGDPNLPGARWLALDALLAAAAVGGLAAIVTIARHGREWSAYAVGFALTVLTRGIAVALIPTPLNTDWGDYHYQAIILASGGAYESARSPGFPFALSLLYRIGGPNPLLGELLNIACAILVGALIVVIARASLGPVAAAAGLYLWAISPGPALFGVVLASENLHIPLVLAAVAAAVLALRGRMLAWVAVGFLLAISQYVRPVSVVLLPAFVMLPVLGGLPRRQASLAILTLTLAFLVTLSPAMVWQWERYGRLTLSTSNYDGLNLLVGLNLKSSGKYNLADVALVGEPTSSREFHDRAYALAMERLAANPLALVPLAVRKFPIMWGDSTYGPRWALDANPHPNIRAGAAMALLSQLVYAAAFLGACAFMFIRRRARDPTTLLIVLCLGAVGAAEVILEVQSRYHAFLEPLIYLLAGGFVAWVAGLGAAGRRSFASGRAEPGSCAALPRPYHVPGTRRRRRPI